MRQSGTHYHRCVASRTLCDRKVIHSLAGVGVERRDARMLDQTNDGVPVIRLERRKTYMLAQRVLIWEVLPRQRLVNYCDLLGTGSILRSELASAHQRDAQGRKVSGCKQANHRMGT